ncbi:hypothetical protein JHK82_025326 [Glycine max]|nr:hypothetical protein JHK82_025326 [Glycine max]
MSERDVPVSDSGSGPETFQGVVKAINERILSVLDENGSGRLDLGMFFAILAPICGGPPDRLKRVAFDALLWRPMNEDGANIRKFDVTLYIKLLRAVYLPSQGVSELMEVCGDSNTSMMSFSEFLVMFDDPDWGFSIMPTLVKLEIGDRNSHGDMGANKFMVLRMALMGKGEGRRRIFVLKRGKD